MNRANVKGVCMWSEDKVKDKKNGGEFLSCVGDPWIPRSAFPSDQTNHNHSIISEVSVVPRDLGSSCVQ